jgi:hypothetical protein
MFFSDYGELPNEVTAKGGAACPQDARSALGTTRTTNATSFRKNQ